ncbi:MAG: radical SAM protein [Deltaproteobacteria bacterium]|nr:radical SAM protein [Deltaproteobacteria bacterium]
MKNINEVLELARRGDSDHSAEIGRYIKGFRNIVLRGAGKFGTAFGAFLIAGGVPREQLCYWDIRAAELKEVNDIKVTMPFSSEFDRERTLIVSCIPNGSLSGSVGEQEFLAVGYRHYLSGMALFEALMCGMKPETGFDAKVCIGTTFCNWCACKRLPSLLYRECKKARLNDFSGKLVFPVATFAINQKCTLKCQHCGQYINHYPREERINFTLERIKTDIDRIFDAVDAIGYVSIIGGEPFLHPALNDIIDLVLGKPNFGVLGITTNGICDIKDKHIIKLNNRKTRLIFSDYTTSLSENQRNLFAKNVRHASESGINFTVGQPLWSTPASLRKLNLPGATKIAMKAGCNSINSCKTIQNGVYYPCSTTAGIGSHHLADYPCDWVRIDATHSAQELREKILQVDEQPHYESCDHCGEGGEMLQFPGEQGIRDQYRHVGGSD